VFCLFLGFDIYAVDFLNISWNEPRVKSKYSRFILENKLSEAEIIRLEERENDYAWKNLYGNFSKLFSNDKSNIIHHNFTKSNSTFDLSFYAGFDYLKGNEEDFYYYNYAVLLSGKINGNLSYYANWYMGKINESNDLSNNWILADTWKQPSGDGFYLDNMTAKINYSSRIGDFSIGRGKFEIGSNISGSIILNDQTNDYGYFSHKIELDNFEVSFLHATLIADSTHAEMGIDDLYYANKKIEEKHLVMHILKWEPTEKLLISAGEQVIYGGREIDISYLLPHTFMRVTEHNLYNRDNVLIFANLDYKISKSNSFYTNFIFDELSKSKLFTNWWANKWAFQIGNVQKIGFRDSRLVLEFVAVRPWMYTHNVLTNKFSHEDRCLGYSSGSNIIKYSAELNIDLHNNYAIDFQSAYSRQGSLGNNFTINYDSRPSDEADWLDGDITDKYYIGAVLTARLNIHNKLKIGYSYEQIRGEDAENQISISYQLIY
jgi:hypothetical protein